MGWEGLQQGSGPVLGFCLSGISVVFGSGALVLRWTEGGCGLIAGVQSFDGSSVHGSLLSSF